MRFQLRGEWFELDRSMVERALRGVEPESIQIHAVEVNGKLYPVKQVVRQALDDAAAPEERVGPDGRRYRTSRPHFTSFDARSILRRLGFRLFEYAGTKKK